MEGDQQITTLIDRRITPQTLDDLMVKGDLSDQMVIISAMLDFADDGQSVIFVAYVRWAVADV